MAASTSSVADELDRRYEAGCFVIAVVIPISIYPILLIVVAAISGIVKAVKRGQAAMANVDTSAFAPELSAVNRKVTPALRSAMAMRASTDLVARQSPPVARLCERPSLNELLLHGADPLGGHVDLQVMGVTARPQRGLVCLVLVVDRMTREPLGTVEDGDAVQPRGVVVLLLCTDDVAFSPPEIRLEVLELLDDATADLDTVGEPVDEGIRTGDDGHAGVAIAVDLSADGVQVDIIDRG